MEWRRAAVDAAADVSWHAEESAREGTLYERFVCGPPSVCSNRHDRPEHPYYDSAFGRVFYESN
eukprot:2988895-Prymnesium_polylepis.1